MNLEGSNQFKPIRVKIFVRRILDGTLRAGIREITRVSGLLVGSSKSSSDAAAAAAATGRVAGLVRVGNWRRDIGARLL
jgi:hypothetical protein